MLIVHFNPWHHASGFSSLTRFSSTRFSKVGVNTMLFFNFFFFKSLPIWFTDHFATSHACSASARPLPRYAQRTASITINTFNVDHFHIVINVKKDMFTEYVWYQFQNYNQFQTKSNLVFSLKRDFRKSNFRKLMVKLDYLRGEEVY